MKTKRTTSARSARCTAGALTAWIGATTLATLLAACGPEGGNGDGGGHGLNVPNGLDGPNRAGTNAARSAAPAATSTKRPADAKLAIALESLRSPKPLDRNLALSGIAPAAMTQREPAFVVPALTWLFSNPKAATKNRAKAGALIALYKEQAASAAPFAIEALDEPGLAWSALRILAATGDAAKPASAKVLAILRDDQAPVKNRTLAIDILRVTESANPTFKSILRILRDQGPDRLKAAAAEALGD